MNCVFLDRDGTLVVDEGYNNLTTLIVFPETIPALKLLKQLGYRLIVVTNQAGINKGLVKEENLLKQNQFLSNFLAERNITLDGIEYCPHTKEENCRCRKPNSGMLLRHICDYNQSWMIGDRQSDVECGQKLRCKTMLLGEINILQAAKLIAEA